MNNKLLVIIILSGYLFSAENIAVFSLDNDYLWIEFGEHFNEADGSITLELHICYGTFPDHKREVFLPEKVQGVYTMNEKDADGKPVFYPLKIIKKNDEAGIHQSVAGRVIALAGSVSMEETIYLDGGPAVNKGLIKAVTEELMTDVHVLPQPQFTVAFGAAYSLFIEKTKS